MRDICDVESVDAVDDVDGVNDALTPADTGIT